MKRIILLSLLLFSSTKPENVAVKVFAGIFGAATVVELYSAYKCYSRYLNTNSPAKNDHYNSAMHSLECALCAGVLTCLSLKKLKII